MQPEHSQELFSREVLELEEKQVIEILINKKSRNEKENDLYDLREFHSFIAPDLELPEYLNIKGLYIATNILRQELGFQKNQKPGDFDIIIIPYDDDNIFFERVGVYEVKVVRPTRANPEKNANSLGSTQLRGLISDGFPFVGLIHVSMTEPLSEDENSMIQFCTFSANSDGKFVEGKTFEDFLVPVKVDHFQWHSVDKQMKRLISLDIPKYVSILCLGLTKNYKGLSIGYCSSNFLDFQKGYFNPQLKGETIQNVKNHFQTFPNKYLKRRMRN